MRDIRRPEMSSDMLARKLREEAKRALMLKPPHADGPADLRREIDRQATNAMRRGLTRWVSQARKQAQAMERIQKRAWKDREKALAEIEKIKPSMAAYPNDGEIRGAMKKAKNEARAQYRRFGLAGQAKANWRDWGAQIEAILYNGLKEKGMSILGVVVGGK